MPEVEATVDNGRIYVKSPYALKDVATTIPGRRPERVNGKFKRWHYPATPIAAETIRNAYNDLDVEIGVDRAMLELLCAAEVARGARAHKSADDLPNIPGRYCECAEGPLDVFPDGTKSHKCVRCKRAISAWLHQRRAYYFAKDQTAAMLIVGMGGGKSKLATALLDAKEAWDAKKVLILCPNNVVGVWPKEFKTHGLTDRRIWAGEVIGRGGRLKKKPSVAERVAAAKEALDRGVETIVVNYESSWREPMADFLLSQEWDVIALDESHRTKAPGGKTSRFMDRLRDRGKRRLALTGTPQPHSPLDIYAQYRFLDPGIFGTNFAKFRQRYAVMGGFEGREVVDWQNLDELSEKMGQIAFVIGQDELDAALGLEVPTSVQRECILSPAAQKVYDAVWNEFVAEIPAMTTPLETTIADFNETHGVAGLQIGSEEISNDDLRSTGSSRVVADNVLTKILRVQQITSGHVTNEDEEKVEIDTAKRDLLEDVLKNEIPSGEPVVVIARFTHDLANVKKIAEKMGLRYGELSGNRKDGLTADAEMNPNIDVLGMQIRSGGVGIDLTRAAYCVYYSIGYSLEDFDQSWKRIHRPGQSRHVTYVHLIARGTIDETVYDALENRRDLVNAVIEAAKK